MNLYPFPYFLSISPFSLHFLILSPFPLYFLIRSPFSCSQAATICVTLEMTNITQKRITLIPSFKNVHTKNSQSQNYTKIKNILKNHSDFSLCKPSSGSYANHHPTSAIMRLHLLKLLDLFHCSLAREYVNNSLFESETYQILTCSKISSHTIQ